MLKPTQKQARAIKNVVDNGGNVYKAMIDAGYSPATAKTPQKLTESKAWESLMDKYLPDESLAKIHKKILKKQEVQLKNNNETKKVEVVKTGQPHSDVGKALDMAYKLKGRYKEKSLFDVPPNSKFTIEIKTDDKNDRSPVALQTESSLGRITEE